MCIRDSNHSAGGMFALRNGKWKLVAGNGSGGREAPKGKPFAKPYQLFDLSSDLGERKDLAQAKPELVGRLKAQLEDIRNQGSQSVAANSPGFGGRTVPVFPRGSAAWLSAWPSDTPLDRMSLLFARPVFCRR